MRELRLVGVEDGAVTLEALDGEKLRLPIDEQVRTAVRSAAINATSSLQLTPRELQDRIRAGETLQQIVAASGVSEDFVTKFAQPVLDELEHVIASALAIRITIEGDRFNDPTQIEFGELIEGRLAANDAKDVRWSSRRIAGGTWQLECSYSILGHEGQSIWLYEPRRFYLAPENEAAIALSNSETIDGPIAKLRSLSSTTQSKASKSTGESPNANSTAPAAFRKSEVSKPVEEVAEPVVETLEPAATTNLLEEMRKRRESNTTQQTVDAADEIEIIEQTETFELEVVNDDEQLTDDVHHIEDESLDDEEVLQTPEAVEIVEEEQPEPAAEDNSTEIPAVEPGTISPIVCNVRTQQLR